MTDTVVKFGSQTKFFPYGEEERPIWYYALLSWLKPHCTVPRLGVRPSRLLLRPFRVGGGDVGAEFRCSVLRQEYLFHPSGVLAEVDHPLPHGCILAW